MARNNKTDAEVEIEIIRLKNSEDVRLAQKELRLKNRRRIYMAQLRYLENRGKELHSQGITFDNIKEKMFSDLPEETEETVE